MGWGAQLRTMPDMTRGDRRYFRMLNYSVSNVKKEKQRDYAKPEYVETMHVEYAPIPHPKPFIISKASYKLDCNRFMLT